MSENEFDLEKLFLPAWAQGTAPAKNYSNFAGDDRPDRLSDDRRGGGRRPGGPRPGGPGRGPSQGGAPRGGERPGGPRREGGGRPAFGGGDRRGPRRDDAREQRPAPPAPLPLAEINVSFMPDQNGVESLARQIKMNGRAYPLFQIARMILQKHERHSISFSVKKNAEGQPVQPLFVCALDETPWLSEDDAIAHVLRKHFNTFYQAERTATEPPKGVYTFVAQCGFSGVILGPPNYHDYQNKLRKLHAEKFARMPFEAFKARVKIVKDEAVVKKWIEDQSFKTEFVCLNLPEPLRLATREEVEKHFREVHAANIIKPVESVTLTGVAAKGLGAHELTRVLRAAWDHQFGFPLNIATGLSQRFADHGLHFFKVNKTVTHVSVARPLFLDIETTPVSDGIKKIVQFINAHPKCSRRKLVESLAPTPKAAAPAPAPVAAVTPAGETAPAAAPVTLEALQPTAEQNAIIADLHWLVHQGHVIEFADGKLETAKKPVPKPPKAPKAAAPAAEAATEVTPAGEAPSASDLAAEADGVGVETPEASAPAAESLATEECPICKKMFKKWEIEAHQVECRYQAEGSQMPKPSREEDDSEVKKALREQISERVGVTRTGQQ
jgi:hypothetical protein